MPSFGAKVLVTAALAALAVPSKGTVEFLEGHSAWHVVPGNDVCAMIGKATSKEHDTLVLSFVWRKVWPAGPARTLIFIETMYLENGGKYVIVAPGVSGELHVPTHDTTIVLGAEHAEKLKKSVMRKRAWSITAVPVKGPGRKYLVPTSGATDAVNRFNACVEKRRRGQLATHVAQSYDRRI